MSVSNQLFLLTGAYIYGRLRLLNLAMWVEDREQHWAALPLNDEARQLADTIMLAFYEVDAGNRGEVSALDVIRNVAQGPAHAEAI
jgi:hypothetical protein